MKKTRIKEAEIETEVEKEKVGIKDILNQGLILDLVPIPIPGTLDQDQGHIIEMVANPRTTQNSIEEKKEKMLL
jgi:hypothetical protein